MKISDHNYSRPYKRRLHIQGEEWSWRVAGYNIVARSPNGKRTVHLDSFELNETTSDEWYGPYDELDDPTLDECCCGEGIPSPPITPGLLKQFIEENVLK